MDSEVETAFEHVSSLAEGYSRDPSDWTLAELKGALAAIAPDMQELEESVQAVEEPGVARRLGIEQAEVKRRREFVSRVKQELRVSVPPLPQSETDSVARPCCIGRH